jgi:hypothetical protein
MNVIEDLYSIVKNMTTEEIKICKKFLNCFRDSGDRSIILFEKLLKKSKYTIDELQISVLGSQNIVTFKRLGYRLKDKILESLTLDINLYRKKSYSSISQIKFEVTKLSIQASILHGRGKTGLAIDLYNKIILKCKEYEIYDLLIETLHINQQISGLTKGKSFYFKFKKQIKYYEKCRAALYKAKEYFHNLIINIAFQANYDKRISSLKNAITDLENELKSINSPLVAYFLYLLKIEYFQSLKLFEEAEEFCEKLVMLVKNEKAIFMERRLGTALGNLANNQLYLFSFSSAEKNAISSAKYYPQLSHNFALMKEIEFYSHFYRNNFSLALKSINGILTPEYRGLSKFWFSKRLYLKSCVLFLQEKFKQAHMMISEIEEIEEDKEGWNIGIRILEIINNIERKLLDIAGGKINNLRVHFQRIPVNEFQTRDKIIYELLRELEKDSFNFKKTLTKNIRLLNLLEQKNYRWQINAPEMIVFHEWFKAKAENRKYDHKESVLKQQEQKLAGKI